MTIEFGDGFIVAGDWSFKHDPRPDRWESAWYSGATSPYHAAIIADYLTGRSTAPVSVGTSTSSGTVGTPIFTTEGVPSVGAFTGHREDAGVPQIYGPVDRRDVPPSKLPTIPWWSVIDLFPTTKGGGMGAFDLGTLITDLGTAYIENRYRDRAGGAPGSVVNTFTGFAESLVDMPGIDVIPDASGHAGEVWDPAANCGNGKWIKRRRRRRRSIMTSAEAAQLTLATSVLKGKQLEIWLAKRA